MALKDAKDIFSVDYGSSSLRNTAYNLICSFYRSREVHKLSKVVADLELKGRSLYFYPRIHFAIPAVSPRRKQDFKQIL